MSSWPAAYIKSLKNTYFHNPFCFHIKETFTTLELINLSVLQCQNHLRSYLCPERLVKMSLEDLREFLQEEIGESIYLNDDLVIEHLKVSMSELRKMKLDLPPPGSPIFPINLYLTAWRCMLLSFVWFCHCLHN